jgi:lipopolysaccharide transport system permease protein
VSVSHANPFDDRPTYRIAPTRGLAPLRLGELWEFRELLGMLAWRQIRVRYKQTMLGVVWAVVQPLATMVVFSVFFGKLAKVPTGGVPYPIFAFAGLLPWQMFAYSLTEASNSVIANQQMLTKVYFPRLMLPLAAVAVGVVDFAVSLALLFALVAWYGVWPGAAIATVPLWTLFAVMTAVAASLWLSALNVRYRDVRYMLPLLTQLWLFVTPVVYPTSAFVPERWRALYALNPLVGVVDGFRWAIGAGAWPGWMLLGVSIGVVTMLLVGGAYYFLRTERTFADVV